MVRSWTSRTVISTFPLLIPIEGFRRRLLLLRPSGMGGGGEGRLLSLESGLAEWVGFLSWAGVAKRKTPVGANAPGSK